MRVHLYIKAGTWVAQQHLGNAEACAKIDREMAGDPEWEAVKASAAAELGHFRPLQPEPSHLMHGSQHTFAVGRWLTGDSVNPFIHGGGSGG